jgi:hypothetical protein
MRVSVTATGFKELDAALAQLPKAAAKRTLQRTLVKAGQPIADEATALAPRDTGELAGSLAVSTRIANNVGKAEFAAVMRAGGTRSEARGAMIAARRASAGEGSFAMAFVGPEKAKTKAAAIKRIVMEFGSVKRNIAPRPYMRPAWDTKQGEALDIVKRELGNEIIATARRLGRSKRQSAQVKFGASMAALMAHEAGA